LTFCLFFVKEKERETKALVSQWIRENLGKTTTNISQHAIQANVEESVGQLK